MADLAALLDKEASAEIEAIHSEAQQRASEIIAEAEDEAEQLVARRERAVRQQHDAALVRARSSAELEAASMRLNAQQQAIEGVFAEAQRRIGALVADERRYAPVLETLLQEAVAGLGIDGSGGANRVGSATTATGDVEIVVHPDERSVAEKVVKDLRLGLPVSTDASVRGGVRLQGAKGSASIENTLYGRLDALRDELASEVSEVLLQKGS